MLFLVINAGSTSTKFSIFEGDDLRLIHSGQFDSFSAKNSLDEVVYTRKIDGEKAEISKDEFDNPVWKVKLVYPELNFDAIGFRVVHGGEKFTKPTLITPEVISEIETLSDLAPLHNPPAVTKINEANAAFPDVPKYAVFDTEFYCTLPEKAFLYTLPYKFYKQNKIRKYGFHGISHEYLFSKLKSQISNSKLEKVITCHLGGGASITAIKNGESIDTSMGFTPLEGLVMATRTGDIDDGVQNYLEMKLNIPEVEINRIYNNESGLLGLSEKTSNMIELLELYHQGDEGAIRAIDLYIYRIRKYIGSYAAALGGLDALVFSGGVGSGSDFIRHKICSDLNFFGIEIDTAKNDGQINVPDLLEIGKGPVRIFAIRTDEELAIAQKIVNLS